MAKHHGAIIPNPIDTPGTRKIVVCIPDTVEWLSLFTGCVSQLRYGWYWDRTTGDLDAIRDRAKRVYFEMQDQNGDCMALDCDEVADCIENSENVQNAIRNWLNNNYQFSNSDYPPNIPLPASQRDADRTGLYNPTCDLDILWAQSFQLVEWMNETITNALEAMEAATNTFEVAGAVSKITGLDEISVDAAFDYGNLLQDFLAENYAAGYDTAYKNNLACEIFCAGRGDCEISLNDIFNIFKARVENYFGNAGTFGVLDDVIDYLTGNTIDTSVVVDAAFFLLWGGVNLANWIVGGLTKDVEIGTKTLNLLLKLAVNDANNDWELLCTECPAEPEPEIGFDAVSGCSGPVGGTNLISLGAGMWSAEGTLSTAGDVRVTIQRVGGGVFQFNSFTSNVGIAASAWTPATGSCGLSIGGLPPANTPLKDFVVAIQDTGTPLEISFNFFE